MRFFRIFLKNFIIGYGVVIMKHNARIKTVCYTSVKPKPTANPVRLLSYLSGYKKPHIATAMLVFCALIYLKIHYRFTRHSSVDLTLGY